LTAARPEVLAIIPARGGSKGIPGKNLRLLAGRPLLAYSCEAATTSRYVTRTVVSTDDAGIASVAVSLGVHVPFLRPAALAGDETPMLDVLQHVVTELRRREGYEADVLVLLQPTSPLRTSVHIDAAVDGLIAGTADAFVSVVQVPHLFNPSSVLGVENGRLVPVYPAEVNPTRRQDKPRLFARNGPAVLAVRTRVVEDGSLYGVDCRPVEMGVEESIDIDGPLDLELAEWFLARRDRRS
jgi:CMP-N,N'-diacetyllegionaminic acid synthase